MRKQGIRLYSSSILIGVLCLATTLAHAAEKPALKAGAAKVEITPASLKNLNMFGGDFKAVHDPIYARALVFDNGASSAAIVALDLAETGDTMELRKRIEQATGIAAAHIVITSSHDHSAPRAGKVTAGGLAHPSTAESEVYTVQVYERVLQAVRQAWANRVLARFGVATGKADVNVNRDQYHADGTWSNGYNPDGKSDKTVWVLKVETLAGEPLAVLFNYAVHSAAVLGTGELSGDLGGAAARYVEKRYGGKLVALYTMGAAGDQNSKLMAPWVAGKPGAQSASGRKEPAAEGKPPQGAGMGPQITDPEAVYDAMNAMGLMLGSEVVRVSGAMQNLEAQVRIAAEEKIVQCRTKPGVKQLGDIKQEQVDAMPLHLSLILLNQVAITGVSGEVVTNIYEHFKQESPLKNAFMLTLANDRVGYIADDASYDTPMFEVNGTPFARGCAEPSIVNELAEMMRKAM